VAAGRFALCLRDRHADGPLLVHGSRISRIELLSSQALDGLLTELTLSTQARRAPTDVATLSGPA
jgi:hypothetical protein